MTNIVVSKKRTILVSANTTGGIIDSTTPVKLQNTPTIINNLGTSRLDQLVDVIANSEINGSTLVYDSATDKYIVEKLDLNNTVGSLDGGQF